MSDSDSWPFDQPRNSAVITVRQILEGEPILHVTHDLDDHGWQFLTFRDADPDAAKVLALQEIVELDPSVLEVATLPPGWHAWREGVDRPWQKAELEAE